MDTNYHNVSYQTPINNSNEEEVTPNKDIQEDYKYNKTPTYEPTSNTPTPDINKKDDFKPFSKMDIKSTPSNNVKESWWKDYLLTISFGLGPFLMSLSDFLVMFKINYINYFNFIDDLVVFVIFILCIFSPCKIIRINKYLKIISYIDLSLGSISRLIGGITSSKSKSIPEYYVILNWGIFFPKLFLLLFLFVAAAVSDKK